MIPIKAEHYINEKLKKKVRKIVILGIVLILFCFAFAGLISNCFGVVKDVLTRFEYQEKEFKLNEDLSNL